MARGAGFDPAVALPPALASLRERVDTALRGFLAERRAALADAEDSAPALVDEIVRLVDAGGKRIRPAFCFLGHLAAGGEDGDPIVRASAALELLHTFALVHDDVMDESERRRGVASSHVHLEAEHRRLGRPGDARRFGRSSAVLIGDLAMVLADELLLASGFPQRLLVPALQRYNRMRTEMAVGQFLDLHGSAGETDERRARRIAALKTASYTVDGPLAVGASLAGATPGVLSALSRFGAPLGEAFQILDDLRGLDDPAGGRDLADAKATLALALARSLAGERDRRFLLDRLGDAHLDPAERRRVAAIVRESGAADAARRAADGLVAEALDALDAPALAPAAAEGLRALAGLVASE